MNKKNIFVLIHSPLVGPLTWKLVAQEMGQRKLDVIVPTLEDSPNSLEPYWKQHAESISQALSQISNETSLTLVAHSGAGPLLPAIRAKLANPVDAYVFVDAGIPRAGATRLELMSAEDSEWAKQFQGYLESGGTFPNWSSDDLRQIIANEPVRRQLVAEINPRALDFFTEPIPAFEGWPDASCIYILFSEPYKSAAAQAGGSGWQTYELESGHFHMLVDPKAVADLIIQSVNKLTD